MPQYRLSKSKILSGLQCAKRLYLESHYPELAEVSDASETTFATGHQVGAIARDLHPGGILIEASDDIASTLHLTRHALHTLGDCILFEAAIRHDGVLIRADILIRENGRLRLIEVKSSTSVKDYHLNDAAIQSWVLEGAGYALDSVWIAHIDRDFVYPGGGNYAGLLRYENVTASVRERMAQAPLWAMNMQQTLAGDMPQIAIGTHCHSPFACPFTAHCSEDIVQPDYPTASLPHGGKIVAQLLVEGYEDIREIPDGRLLNNKQLRVRRAVLSGGAELDCGIAQRLAALAYPRYYLDFETIQFAVPIWAGTRPYEQLLFQWSCHRESASGAEIQHEAFLDNTGDSPMRAAAETLIAALDHSGPILVYGHFESMIIWSLAARFSDLAPSLLALRNRIVDLLPLARQHYYHPAMACSWSLKSLLPTIAPELSYDTLEVRDGNMAQQAYLELLDTETTVARRAQLEAGLLEYCARDTLALVKVAQFFAANGGQAIRQEHIATTHIRENSDKSPPLSFPRKRESRGFAQSDS